MASKKPTPAALVAFPQADFELVADTLAKLEHSGSRHRDPCCPMCEKVVPLDPANPREWEQHKPDCALGRALEAVRVP